jgi:hypothetical protein
MPVLLRLALAFLFLAPRPASPGPVGVETERRGDAVEIHAAANLDADVATAWQVLTDYDGYTRFIPDLWVSRVVARHGTTVIVEQSGAARLWLLRIPLEITFEISESPRHSLRSRAVAGSMRALESRYVLTPTSSGTRLEYTGHVVPGFPFFARTEEYAVGENVTRQFRALVDEIERRGAPADHGTVSGAR